MSDVGKEIARISANELSIDEINDLLNLVLQTKKNLRECLPGHGKTWDMLIPDTTLNQIRSALDSAKRNEQSLSEHRGRLETITAEIEQINSLDTCDAWQRSREHLAEEIDTVKSALGRAPQSTGRGPARVLKAVIARVERERKKWNEYEKSIHTAASHLVNHTFHTADARPGQSARHPSGRGDRFSPQRVRNSRQLS